MDKRILRLGCVGNRDIVVRQKGMLYSIRGGCLLATYEGHEEQEGKPRFHVDHP